MISAYTFTAKSIVDLIAVIALMAIALVFFIRKKSIKLTAIYLTAVVFFVAMVLLDELFYIPVARAVAEMYGDAVSGIFFRYAK
jgi:uncharacterized membrane protein YhfC